MSRGRLIRYAGPAAMLGGALYIATFGMVYVIYGLFPDRTGGTFLGEHAFIHAFEVPMYVFLLLGATGLYLRQRDRFGLAGKAGFYLTAFGFALGAVGGAMVLVIGPLAGDGATAGFPDLVAHALSHVFYAAGSVLLGIATYRAGVLPKEPAVMAGVGPAWQLALFFTGAERSFTLLLPPSVLTALGWMWLGYALFREKKVPAATAPVAR